MAAGETLQVRLDSTMKQDLEAMSKRQGISLSENVRQLLSQGLYQDQSPVNRLDALFSQADERVQASGLPEVSAKEIVAFCSQIKKERAQAVLAF